MYGPGNCYDMTMDCYENGSDETCNGADQFCLNNVEYIYDNNLNRDEDDLRYIAPDPFPPEYYVDYLNTPHVQAAIGAFVNYTEFSAATEMAFTSTGDDDRQIGAVAAVKRILDSNVTLIMYTGDADYTCNWLGGQAVAHEINATGFAEAGFANISSADGRVKGQVRQAGTYAFVRIYDSGHEVPFYQPLLALEMFGRVLNATDIETGKTKLTSSYRTKGPQESTYREGNSTVQYFVVGQDAPVVYNTQTHMPMYENGTSANTGPPKEKRWVDDEVEELSERELLKREMRRAAKRRSRAYKPMARGNKKKRAQ